jgi:Ser/Thr protein kinase RdoA (MazF antagonist)
VKTESLAVLSGMHLMLETIEKNIQIPLQVPTAVASRSLDFPDDKDKTLKYLENCEVYDGSHTTVAVLVFTWIEGITMSSQLGDVIQLQQVGRALVEIYHTLSSFDHIALHRTHMWDIAQFHITYLLVDYIDCPVVRDVIHSVHKAYQLKVESVREELPHSIIMGDCNNANIIVDAIDR